MRVCLRPTSGSLASLEAVTSQTDQKHLQLQSRNYRSLDVQDQAEYVNDVEVGDIS